MKSQHTTSVLIAFAAIAILFASCKETRKAEQATASSKADTNSSYIDLYMKLKDALVADDSTSASIHAKTLASAVLELNGATYQVNDEQSFKLAVKEVAKSASQIPNADLSAQREHFESITENMIGLIKSTGAAQEIYVQHCPMYNQGKGGYWLSQFEEVKNPLFGSMMLNCGFVSDRIKQ